MQVRGECARVIGDRVGLEAARTLGMILGSTSASRIFLPAFSIPSYSRTIS